MIIKIKLKFLSTKKRNATTIILLTLQTLPGNETCHCKRPYLPNRIVGGSVVTPHSIPFQVGLTPAPSGTVPFCGGSLITPNYVLTAAHCTIDSSVSSFRVIVGDHNYLASGEGEQFINVRSKLEHPGFNPASSYAFDFSILRLDTSVTVPSPTAGIVCLPSDLSQTFVGENLKISGWGRTVYGGSQSNLLKGSSVTGEKCFPKY